MSNRTVPQFAEGELVNISIRGARVGVLSRSAGDTFATLALGSHSTVLPLNAPGVTVERVAPAEWPPQPGDVWEDRNRAKWFGTERGDGVRLTSASGDTWSDFGEVLGTVGPMRLLYRDGWTPATETAPAEAGPGRVLTESEKRAEMIAGLRELADLLEARPDLYFDHSISMATTFQPDPRGEVERWADVLGVTTAHEKAGGNIHHRAVGNVRGLSLFVVTIEKPEPAATQPDEPVEDDQAGADPEAPMPAPAEADRRCSRREEPHGAHKFLNAYGLIDCPGNQSATLPRRAPDPDAASLLAESLADGAA